MVSAAFRVSSVTTVVSAVNPSQNAECARLKEHSRMAQQRPGLDLLAFDAVSVGAGSARSSIEAFSRICPIPFVVVAHRLLRLAPGGGLVVRCGLFAGNSRPSWTCACVAVS
jgi:hypothetical protein